MEDTRIQAATNAEVAEIGSEAAESAITNIEATEGEAVPFWQGADTADKLSYAALLYGVPEEELIDAMLRQSGDNGERWEGHITARREAAEQQMTDRLAREFDELSAQVPEIGSVQDVPREVAEAAADGKQTLLDAYLRRWYVLSREAAAQIEAQQSAAARSAGSLGGEFDEPDPKNTAFSRAFRMALA